MKDHDLPIKGNGIAKVGDNTPRPHADGCVGCRRAGVCIKCGKPAMLGEGRCLSGACSKCCPKMHAHVNGDPMQIAQEAPR